LQQWIDRIESFLGIDRAEIGTIGNGKRTIGERITVALVQSLYKCADEVAPHIGHLIVDECHRAPSRTFTEAVTAFDCKYTLGLSATPWRRDKLSRLIFLHLGDVRHSVEAEKLIEEGSILRAEVITRQTDFKPLSDPSAQYSRMLSELTEDEKRNRLIASDIAQETGNGGGILLALSDRKAHCEALQRILQKDFGQVAEVLTGDLPSSQRQALVDRLNAGKVRVLIATGQLIGEGFDCKALSTLFLVTPIRFSGRVLQYLGRVLRPAPGKDKARVYDYVDMNVGPLVSAAKARQKAYGNCQPVN
jgi:superfamily II DNA or RNA helicase